MLLCGTQGDASGAEEEGGVRECRPGKERDSGADGAGALAVATAGHHLLRDHRDLRGVPCF